MKFHIITAVWGERHTNLFVEICLPNLLAEGNLPSLKNEHAVYKIFTSSKYAARIFEHENFRKLRKVIRVEVYELDNYFGHPAFSVPNSILVMTQLHKIAVESANYEDAAMIFLPPDQIYSDGAFSRLPPLAMSGKRVVMTPSSRLSLEAATAPLNEVKKNCGGLIRLSQRELVRIALASLHPISQFMFIDAAKFTKAPTHIYWKARDGILARCLHIHPLMIWPKVKRSLTIGNFDTDYLEYACPDYEDYHVVTDSDEIAVFELSTDSYDLGVSDAAKLDTGEISNFINKNGNSIHKRFLRNVVKIHAGDLTSEWAGIEAQSHALMLSLRI